MASGRRPRLPKALGRVSLTGIGDSRGTSPPVKSPKKLHRKRSTTISSKDSRRRKNSPSPKGNDDRSIANASSLVASIRQRLSVANVQTTSEAQPPINTLHSRSIDEDLRCKFREVNAEHQNKDNQITQNRAEFTLDENDKTPNPESVEGALLQIEQQKRNVMNLLSQTKFDMAIKWGQQTDQKDAVLEEKLSKNHELDTCGTMDLTSVNMADHAITSVIKRAFQETKRKYTHLCLRENGLTSYGVRMLVDALLGTPTKLKSLVITNNAAIGDEGVEHLVRLLKGKRSITSFALHHSGITDQGVLMIADALCSTNTNSSPLALEKLHLSSNKSITDGSLEAFMQIMVQNQNLKSLALQQCSLSKDGLQQLKKTAAKRKKKLNFSG